MKLKYILFFGLIFFNVFAQKKEIKKIDSLNNLPFEIRLKDAAVLDEIYLKNAEEAAKINYNIGEAKSYSNLSLVYYYQGKYEKDLIFSLRAIHIFEKINDLENLSLEWGELGYRMKKRNLDKAILYMQKAKYIAEKSNLRKPLLSIYNNYGVLKEMKKEYDSALFYYNKGLALKERIKDKVGIPYSLNNIAGVFVLRKQYDEAEINYNKALQIRKEINDTVGIAENYSYLGDMYLFQNECKKAINYYQKSVEITDKYKYFGLSQDSYKKISDCYESLNDDKNALIYFKKHSSLKDSLINQETNAKIAELEIKFDTNEKEKQLLQKQSEVENSRIKVTVAIIFAILASIIGFLFYRQQKLKNKQQHQEFELKSTMAQVENQNKLQEQRLSISRDLHDNIGAQLTFIISSLENTKFGIPNLDVAIEKRLEKISDFTRNTIVELRDTIWAMNKADFTMEDLSSRIFNFVEHAQSANHQIQFNFSIDKSLENKSFSSVVGVNLYRTIQEAVNNAMKHADATQIIINTEKLAEGLRIEIKDDGKGFDLNSTDFGNGLLNMNKRIEEINGNFSINSEIGKGTRIRIELENFY
ncbi:tetratricopeptide repeat protein [Cloacibacterium sp.]|uniref:tetratricopeptide repeat-containing sensor histidine kinase n=1 Tax=Cloacibacterium sp. TaxID=1913682 RepID=UPI0035AFEE05